MDGHWLAGWYNNGARHISPSSLLPSTSLTNFKFQWENKAKEDYKPEKKVAALNWPRSHHMINCNCESTIV